MKVFILTILLAAFVAGCRTIDTTKVPTLYWSIVKSEVTGKCYDAANAKGLFTLGSEVPCP